jgi:MFS family permease
MGKRILAVIAGLISAFVLIALIQYISYLIYPPPEGFDYKNEEAMRQLMQTMPAGAFGMLIFAYAVGSFVGGLVAGKVSGRTQPAIILGVVLTVSGIVNLVKIEHPMWFSIVSTIIYIPMALLGSKMVVKTPVAA